MPKNNPVNKTKISHYANMGIGNSCCSLPPEVPEKAADTQGIALPPSFNPAFCWTITERSCYI